MQVLFILGKYPSPQFILEIWIPLFLYNGVRNNCRERATGSVKKDTACQRPPVTIFCRQAKGASKKGMWLKSHPESAAGSPRTLSNFRLTERFFGERVNITSRDELSSTMSCCPLERKPLPPTRIGDELSLQIKRRMVIHDIEECLALCCI